MVKNVVISAKITADERDDLRKLKLKPSRIIQAAIRKEIKRAKMEQLTGELEKLRPVFAKLKIGDIVEDIREDRDR